MKGQYRYILTRICLNEGSLTIQKSLEPLVAEGISVIRTEKGDEYPVSSNAKQRRIYGLKPYYDAYQLNPNDVLKLEHAGAGVVQVAIEVKASNKPSSASQPSNNYPRPVVPPPPQRVVVEESAYLREVRLERRTPDQKPAEQKPAPRDTQARPQREVAQPQARQDLAQETRQELRNEQRPAARPAAETRPVEPRSTQSPSRPAPLGSSAPVSSTPAVSAPSVDPLVERFAHDMGYQMRVLSSHAVMLEAQLGAHSYSVLVSTRADWDVLRQSAATYRAVLVGELGSVLPPSDVKVTLVTREALEVLLGSNRMGNITPVELRGYWSAEVLNAESARSITEFTGRQLGERGVFSQVMLTLAQYPAHTSFRLEDVLPQLEGVVGHDELLEILMTLTRQPFLALSALPRHEFYVRSSTSELLGQLSEYARGLQVRLKVTGPTRSPQTAPNREAILR